MKIVVTNNQDFTKGQKQRLDGLGDVTYHDSLPSGEEYLDRIKGADIICSGTAGLQDSYGQLKNVYITVGFVSVAFVDLDVLKSNGVTISNAPGINRHAVSEWIIFMMIYLARDMGGYVNSTKEFRKDGGLPSLNRGLADRKLTILGNGHIGNRVKEVAESLAMQVTVFKRGDDLTKSVVDADIVVDVLSSNESTRGLLDASFFNSLKKGTDFITVTRQEITDEEAMFKALENGTLNKVATDAGGILVGDTDDEYYKRLLAHPNIICTPHISYSSEMSSTLGNDTMIDNVEAFVNGNPQNILN